MKKVKETNEQIKERLKTPRLDSNQQDAEYILKMLLGFEPLDDTDEILKKTNENNDNKHS